MLKLTDRINEYKAVSQEIRLRQGLGPTAVLVPPSDRHYHRMTRMAEDR